MAQFYRDALRGIPVKGMWGVPLNKVEVASFCIAEKFVAAIV
jgi:hypothetical protein